MYLQKLSFILRGVNDPLNLHLCTSIYNLPIKTCNKPNRSVLMLCLLTKVLESYCLHIRNNRKSIHRYDSPP